LAITQAIKAHPRRSVFSNFEISPNLDAIARVGRPGRPARPLQQPQRVPAQTTPRVSQNNRGDYAILLDIAKREGGVHKVFVHMGGADGRWAGREPPRGALINDLGPKQ